MTSESGKKIIRDVTVLVVMNDKFFRGILDPQLEESCKVEHATSLLDAEDEFELKKSNLDFVVMASCLEDTRIDTLVLSKKMRSDPKFKGTLIAVGNQRKELVGDDKCHFECLTESLANFLIPLILELQKQKDLLKVKNNLKVA